MKDVANTNSSSRSSSSMPRKKWSVALLILFVLTPLVLYSFMFPSPPSDVPLLGVEEVIDEEEPEEEEPLAVLPSVPPVSSSLLSPPAGTRDEDAVLLELQRKVKVIVTTVARNRARVELLRRVYHDDPWARDLFVFISDTEEPDLGTITVPKCNAIHSWVSAKCCRFAHFYFSMWEEQYPEVEWVFKADDDSYVHPRNLLLAVASLQRSAGDKPLFLGDRTSWGHGRRDDDPAYADLRSLTIWPHGGAGWLLNRAARDHLKAKPSLSCGGLDDVGFGQWATRHGVPLTPYFGFHQRTAFEGKLYEEGHSDFLGSVKPAAFFLCVKDDVIRLPYYPVTFHKLMATFPQMHAIMQRKRFELLPLPQLRPEDRHLESRGDNYYRRVRPWLEALAANETAYAHTDCRSLFDLEAIWQLKRDMKLP